jgi:signal transduction histidine kinase
MFTDLNDLASPPITDHRRPGPAAERRKQPRQRPTHVRAWVLLAATLGAALTLLIGATSLVQFAYQSIPLHVAVETTAAMASIVAAQLVSGRFRSTLQLRDLVLFASLSCFAVTNLLLSAVPALISADPGRFRTWAPVAGAVGSTALMAIAAFAPSHTLRRPEAAIQRTLFACAVGCAAIAAAVFVAGDLLPVAVAPSAIPGSPRGPRMVGDSVVIIAQMVSVLLFAAAAGGFAARANEAGDLLARWLAVGATLGAFARLNYALFPSLYTEWFYTGDVLRLACFAAVFAGAVQETRSLQRALSQSAIVDERHRIARNLHDGVAQDLAYILQQLRRLADHAARPPGIDGLVTATERALDESRHAVAALARATDRPLGEVLAATAREAGEREGSVVEIDLAAAVVVPARVQEELLRVVREAVINAARHGRAQRIRVELREDPRLRISVIDDGRGFDPDAKPVGRLGLEGMRARVRAIGGELTIRSTPGTGSEVRVTLP